MITLESRSQQGAEVLMQQVADAVVLLKTDTGQYYALDEVGGRVWQLSDGQRTAHQIAALLAQEYDAPLETIETDVLALLQELAADDLIVEAS